MAVLADRVRETSTTTGTGTFTLAGALPSYQSFNATFTNGALVYYVIQSATDYEIGVGTVGTGTLARTTVLRSSNAGALVPFAAGPKDVFVSYVADRAVTTVDAATLTNKTIDDYTNFIGANQLHIKVKATATLALGTVCKAVGWNAGENAVEVAAVSSTADIAIGVTDAVISIGDLGEIINTGYLEGINTNAFAPGTILYPNTSGGFTATKPSSGTYQAVAFVLRQNVSNGTVFVEFTNPQSVEASTNTANTIVLRDGSGNFAAGTMTGNVTGNVSGSSGSTTGNASTATALQTDRNINGVAFNGTADITVTAAAGTLTGTTLASGVTASSLTSVGTLGTLAVSGNATFDTNTLFVDAANNAVGIGTTSPLSSFLGKLAVTGNITASNGGKLYQFDSTNSSGRYMQALPGSALSIGKYDAGGDIEHVRLDSSGKFTVSSALAGDVITNLVNTSATGYGVRTQGGGGSSALYLAAFNDYAGTAKMLLDGSGNLGLGVTPSAWIASGGSRAFQFSTVGALYQGGSGGVELAQNAYESAVNTYRYLISFNASRYEQQSGQHKWFTAPSGTAGAAITFTQAMTLDASGNLGIGIASPATRLHVDTVSAGYGITIAANGQTSRKYQFGVDANSNLAIYESVAAAQRVVLDQSGNLGFGVTPSASDVRTLQFPDSSVVGSRGNLNITGNAYFASSAWRYHGSAAATWYRQDTGTHAWFTAPSGTAGNAISFTQAMTLDAGKRLLLGYTSNSDDSAFQIDAAVSGSINYSAAINNSSTSTSIYNVMRFQQGSSGSAVGMIGTGGSTVTNATFQNTFVLGTQNAKALVFATNDIERARIDTSGNLALASGYIRVAGASAGAASTTTIGSTTATTVGATGAASALPANPLGYIIAHVGTTQVKIPYYTA